MLKFLYALNFSLVRKKTSGNFLWTIKYIFLRKVANIFVKFYYKFPYKKIGINKTIKREKKYIVSLTTFPGRINVVWIAIESLLRQRFKPDEIILWLAKEQFNGLEDIPIEIIKQQERGLTIRFCDDLRSHKKYYYAFKEFSEDVIITVDDDVIYPNNTLEVLVGLHKKHPNCICSNRAHVITKKEDNLIDSYNRWVNNPRGFQGPSKLLCPTGVSGVLYPPNSVDREIFNKESIKNLCFYADDLWLKIMSLKKGTHVVKSASFPDDLFTIESSQNESLGSINVAENKNDEQLQAILRKYDISL
ncbi:glycosyltransferase family A protein [Rossellomorea yichunensis]|uniref:glycosyltransferase family A protein n=1 Tax=Rossellomorea yichunensis TaxID=3077331 RepID=UPI0028DEA01C|nr:glycosyltransferase family A protein [Rossellomorea sp. YC4-1]MDT9026820.1 glycosyltransferase family A protein [Rossellomorea sp. YC4-1]